MKTIKILFVILLFTVKVNAQWVTIPDTNFVNFLQQNYPQCMNGNQMNTQCNEIVNETTLNCMQKYIHDLTGLQYFINLDTLNCSSNELTYLPPLPNNLKRLYFGMNWISSLPSLPATMTEIYGVFNMLNSLPALPNTLKELVLNFNLLNTLPPLPESLRVLQVANNNTLTELPDLPDTLFVLEVSYNPNLKCFPELKHIKNSIKFINTPINCWPNYPDLGAGAVSDPPLTSIPLCYTFNPDSCVVITTDIPDRTVLLEYSIYPNPTYDNLSISFSINNSSEVKIELYNSLGQIVKNISKQKFTPGKNQFNFSTENISKGIYHIKFSVGDDVVTRKLVKM